MIRTMKRLKILFGAATLALCGTLVLGMTNEAPLILYPITPSLPPSLYVRTFEPPKVGTIAAFRVPEAAKLYKASIGETVHDDFLFMKPIVAAPGDLACNELSEGLHINGELFGSALTQDSLREALPFWKGCRRLGHDEFFTASGHARSFDSRNYGPMRSKAILATYKSLRSQPIWREGR